MCRLLSTKKLRVERRGIASRPISIITPHRVSSRRSPPPPPPEDSSRLVGDVVVVVTGRCRRRDARSRVRIGGSSILLFITITEITTKMTAAVGRNGSVQSRNDENAPSSCGGGRRSAAAHVLRCGE